MILGLTGEAGAGKDTVGAILVERHGFVRLAFADAMREALLVLDPWVAPVSTWADYPTLRLSSLVHAYGWDGAKRHPQYGPEVRRLLEQFGDAAKLVAEESVFADHIDRKIREACHLGSVVVTDVRFPTEVRMLRGWGATIVEVQRPDNPHAIVSTHRSARRLDRAAYRIVNDRDTEALAGEVAALLDQIRTPRRAA